MIQRSWLWLVAILFFVVAFALGVRQYWLAAPSTITPVQTRPVETPMVGADRDAHGCIGSAGYAWCARRSACVRPWELAAELALPLNAQAFSDYCAGKSVERK